MRHFCTYFDSHYALRGLTLFRSMQRHCGNFTLHVLCCDGVTFDLIRALKIDNLRPYRLEEVEAFEPRLQDVKPQRSRAEYLWTLSPIWPLFLLERRPEIDLICYLDADLFFFSSDEPIWNEFGAASVLIIEHRFPPETQHMVSSGQFNVGLMAYRRDANGLACLEWYRERCLEWCYDAWEDGKYGDQKYLDEFPHRFSGVHILQHPGANVAPWNWMNGPLQKDGAGFSIGGQPLIFYHFHGLKIFNSWLFDVSMHDINYGRMPMALARSFHHIYISALMETARWANAQGISLSWGYTAMRNYGRRLFLSKLKGGRFLVQRGMR